MEDRFEATWDESDLLSTERMLAGMQLQVKATGDPFLYVQLMARVARCQILGGRFEAAQETLNDLDFVLGDAQRRLPGADRRQAARAWGVARLELARFFAGGGFDEAAATALAEARRLAEEADDDDLRSRVRQLTNAS